MLGKNFISSWSGGKDSCLAASRAMRSGGTLCGLLTMMIEGGERSRSHGLAKEVLRAQADALGVPLVMRATSWEEYEETFTNALRDFKGRGIDTVVFGDIDIERHRAWEETVCRRAHLEPLLPLWKGNRRDLLEEFLELRFQASIVAVREGVLNPRFLGRALTPDLVRELEEAGVDACGENGEYHTVVTSGPILSKSIRLVQGEHVLRNGCWFMDVSVERP